MKTNIQIKAEPIEISNCSTKTVNELVNLYDYNQITKLKSKDSIINQEQESSTCVWCQKLGSKSFILNTDNGDSKILCSEICFNQYRRASFKKNKDSTIHQTIKIKSTHGLISEKRSKSIINDIEYNHHQDTNRRKNFSIQTKLKTHEFSRNLSPLSKRHCSSSSTEQSSSSNLPINPNYSNSFFLPPPPIDINRFQYPFFSPSPPVPQMPLALPLTTTSSSSSEPLSSTLFPSLTKGLLSNYTCILPTFIPLPIPIPICFPVHLPCIKCSKEVINQECQTDISNDFSRIRRMSF